ncbi:MAG: YhfC family intramembrane metalloprotease [Clostridia bacterium]|nr:YhfC family intramembrane metalloprotease [Clostridia bacterium]
MNMTVPILSIVCMALAGVAGFAIPVALFLYFRLKKRADFPPFLVGCAVMFIFALTLESLMHQLVLGSAVGETIRNNIWLYALYGGLAAGVFEETGRFLAFRTVLKKYRGRDINALMYGAGHGGFEAAMVLGVAMFGNIALAVLMNAGQLSAMTASLPAEAVEQLQPTLETLARTEPYTFLVGIVERVFAAALQLSLSVLVWFAAKNRKKVYLYPVAVLIHFAADGIAAVLLNGLHLPTAAVEAAVGATAVLTALLAKRIWKRETAEEPGLPE